MDMDQLFNEPWLRQRLLTTPEKPKRAEPRVIVPKPQLDNTQQSKPLTLDQLFMSPAEFQLLQDTAVPF